MAKSELHFLGHIVDLITVKTDYNKKFDQYKGTPVLYNGGGLLRFVFELGENFHFLERMTTINYDLYKLGYPVDEGKVVFYDANDDFLKTWKFKDAPIVYYKVKFAPNGDGMTVEMILSPAIQDYGCKIHRSWHLKPIEEETYQSLVYATEKEEETSLKFITRFERLGNYKGEFGFDWMRDDYKDICNDYEKLKKEYFPTSIHEKEYFVPSLSMFPNQENVKLKLAIKKKEGTISDVDVIKLPAKNGIRFDPDEVKVSEADGKQITVICESPLSSDLMIDLLDKNDKKVGAINVVKNDEELSLKVKLVKVLGNEPDNRYNEQTFNSMTSTWENVLFDNLTNKCFNQALIKVEKDTTEEMVIDVDKYIEEGALDAFVDGEGKREIPRMNKSFDKKLYEDFVAKNGKYKGIIFFLSAMHQKGTEAGHGYPYPRDINYIMIVPSSVGGTLETYRHELGHALGLHHVWDSSDIYKDRISVIDAKQKELEEWLNRYKEYPNTTKIGNTSETLGQRREEYRNWINRLSLEEKDKVELSTSLFTFDKSSTENIMDYPGHYISENGERITLINPNNLFSFWQWQWKMMIKEVKKYHGK